MPGLQLRPFELLAAGCGYIAWWLMQRADQLKLAEAQAAAVETMALQRSDEPISASLAIDPIRIELGYGLLGLINNPGADHRLEDQVSALRKQRATDYGFILPAVRLLDNLALHSNDTIMFIEETEVGRGELRGDNLLVACPDGDLAGLP